MGRIRVVTDSTADLDESEAQRLGITVVPLNVHWNGETYQDKSEITADEFFRKLREEKGTPKTSQPSAGQFEAAYRTLLEDADEVIAVTLASKLSGTYNSALLGAQNVDPKRITVIDSQTISFTLGSLAIRVARLAEQGASVKDCLAMAEDLIPRLKMYACVDTLEFLRRGGRIGKAQAFAGNLLSVKLIFEIRGEVLPIDRVRTRAAAIKRTAEVIGTLGAVEEMSVLYSDERAPAEQLAELLKGYFPGLPMPWSRFGPVLGTHTGPGVIGACAVLAK